MNNQNEMVIKNTLDAWYSHINRADQLINGLTDEKLQQEVAPGRNTGVYLLGHLTAVHDVMIPLLGMGEKLYPEMTEIFIYNPDKSGLEKPSVEKLRLSWKEVNGLLESKFKALQPNEWLERHTSVSPEDFEKEPHRNKLNVLISRTNHLAYHFGQLAFLK